MILNPGQKWPGFLFAEKVGQMIQPELKYVTPADVKKFHIGSVLNGGGTTPNNDKFASVQDWANLAEQF